MRQVAMWFTGLIVVLLVMWGAIHIIISPINPEQETPTAHFDSACWTCHLVLSSAELQ